MAAHDISLADVTQDIAGAVPPDLVLRWNDSDKSPQTHARLLQPYLVRGTIVSSDAAGLSKLTQQLSLPEVMKLVSEPKELLHALGKAIGGQAIGVWAADNAQMFFRSPIDPALVVEQMLAVQQRGKTLPVKIGIGIHFGECVSVAGGLFGADADFIEHIAEDDTKGGEIVVSRPVYARLRESLRTTASLREDLADRGSLWSIVDCNEPVATVEGADIRYPMPFGEAFFKKLRETSIEALARDSFDDYRRATTVAFIKINRPHQSLLLNAFTEMSLADLSIRRVASSYRADVVKSTGSLAIVLFDDVREGIRFAREVVRTNQSLGINARVGLAKGEVFLFPLANGGREIAGNSVNIASKLSEDAGIDGILVEKSAVIEDVARFGRPFGLTISGVSLEGCVIQA